MNALSDPTPVRLLESQRAELEEISTLTGVDLSKLIRLAVKAGIPEIISKFGVQQPGPPLETPVG